MKRNKIALPKRVRMAKTITVQKAAIADLMRVKDDFDSKVESLELMQNRRFMQSYKKSKEQVKKRAFANWHEL